MAQTVFIPEGTNGTAFSRDDKNLDLLDTVNGLAQKNARMWQIIALASLSSLFIALGVLIYAESLPRTVPVVVTVAPDGRAEYVGALDPKSYSAVIPEVAKEYVVKEFVTKMHTWVIDEDAQQRYIAETQALVQRGAVNELDQFYRANNPFEHLGEIVQSVDIEAPHKQADKTYFMYFTVTRKTAAGYEASKTRFSALINIDEFTPAAKNPSGVFVTHFDIKRGE
jgi:type IV secretory pathway TrbF-like protein